MAKDDAKVPSKKTSQANIDAFLEKARLTPAHKTLGQRGRLLFAMDATASRQPSWDMAARIQGEMFHETAALGGLEIQLAFYRGFGEFKASRWTADENTLLRQMTSVFCLAGETQIGKVLSHAVNETKKKKINVLVFVGDCFEEDIDHAGKIAGELGLLGVPAFMFHEGGNPIAAFAFQQVAKLTNGAYCQFDSNSAQVLKDLLGAVAVYAAGGRLALESLASKRGGEVLKLVHQVKDR
ncbi:MAG TPA: VWA domain-containing protein [Rhodospirillales bacterium]|nr:VWA domain-containing protein [Rhodospirillales bacterium]